MIKRIRQVLLYFGLLVAAYFLPAGRYQRSRPWSLVVIYAGGILVTGLIVARTSPDLFEERSRIKEGAKEWDKKLALGMGVVGPFLTWLVAGIDVRFDWSPPPPDAIQVGALILAALGQLTLSWAMISNRFFSPVVRIQKERGHVPVSAGPYAFVRHPGYLGMIALTLATPDLLGSKWAFLPALASIAIAIVRTVKEDATLLAELDGYWEYSQHVRYRLVPGVW